MKTKYMGIHCCQNCPHKPSKIKRVRSYVCKWEGEWYKYHNGINPYSLQKCTHPEYGGKDCCAMKFNEQYCDYDDVYECECDDLGWCKGDYPFYIIIKEG